LGFEAGGPSKEARVRRIVEDKSPAFV